MNFLSAQLIVSLEGKILEVAFSKGHNNDQGFYKITGTDQFLKKEGFILLADGGYSDKNSLITPKKHHKLYDFIQSFLRMMVEHINSQVKCFQFASGKVRCSPEMHILGMIAIYKLVALELDENPRTDLEDAILNLEARTGISIKEIYEYWDQTLNPNWI